MNLHNIITGIIVLLFVYGWYLIFFTEKAYMDNEGNIVSKRDWEKSKEMDKLYD